MMLNIEGWKLGLRFSACHMIPKHKKCSRMHGHTYTISARVHGDVDDKNHLIMDFGELKKALRATYEDLDHKLMVASQNEHTNILDLDDLTDVAKNSEEEPMASRKIPGYYELTILDKHYVMPKVDIVILDIKSTTAEELAGHFLQSLLDSVEIPPNVTKLEVGIEEGEGQGAWATKEL